jgi:hypothetical protein
MAIFEESDRRTVLVSSAMLDESLGKILRAHFMSVAAATGDDMDFLFERQPLPPLGSLAIKNRFAFCLGLISLEIREAINAFRDVRNEFAHTSHSMSLSAQHIESILNRFSESKKAELLGIMSQLAQSIRDARQTAEVAEPLNEPSNPRLRTPSAPAIFLTTIVAYLLGYLQSQIEHAIGVSPTAPETPPPTPE